MGLITSLGRPGLLRSILSRLRLTGRLLRDPQVPLAVKALAALPALYVISPVDLLPDVIPILGQLDDIGVVLLVIEALVALCPTYLVDHHRQALETGRPYSPSAQDAPSSPPAEGTVIDAAWRRDDGSPRPR